MAEFYYIFFSFLYYFLLYVHVLLKFSCFLNYFKVDEASQEVFESLRNKPIIGENFPPLDEGKIGTGSTDVGDVSWIAPLSLLRIACYTTGTSAHDWGVVATGGMSIGHKGMLHAAKIMALVAVDLFDDPVHLEKATEEFNKAISKKPYKNPIPDYVPMTLQLPATLVFRKDLKEQ